LGSSLTVSWHLNLANSRSILGDLHGSAAALNASWEWLRVVVDEVHGQVS
jgi:hypothetical protein